MITKYSKLKKEANKVSLDKAAQIAKEMKVLVQNPSQKQLLPGKALAYYLIEDDSFESVLKKKGIPVTSIVPLEDIGSIMGGAVYRLKYSVDKKERVALVLPLRIEIDAFAEEVLIYNKGEEPIDTAEIKDSFLQARELEQNKNKIVLNKLEELDKEVPKGFRTLVLSKKGQAVAKNIYLAKGVLNQAVFEPYRGTLAYPETEEEAVDYFKQRFMFTPLETYLLVGELVAKNLI